MCFYTLVQVGVAFACFFLFAAMVVVTFFIGEIKYFWVMELEIQRIGNVFSAVFWCLK